MTKTHNQIMKTSTKIQIKTENINKNALIKLAIIIY